MKIAIPTARGTLAPHFGHCESFTIMEVDEGNKKIIKTQSITAPPHQPGLLPSWLAEQGVDVVIAGGMGERAKQFFNQYGIQVLVGAPVDEPERITSQFLNGTLELGANVCNH